MEKPRKEKRRRPRYISENKNEGLRLTIKTDQRELYEELSASGLQNVKSSSVIVDAGCGVGIVSEEMCKFLSGFGKPPQRVILLDMSTNRLNEASHRLKKYTIYSYVSCDLSSIPIADGSADFVFCRFVFEYLKSPRDVFAELKRIVRPGGKLVIGDLDTASIAFFPFEKELDRQFKKIIRGLAKTQFDDIAGRKLYQYFYESGMKKIKVHVKAHNLMYGTLNNNIYMNWKMKMDILEGLQARKEASFGVDIANFRKKFMRYLQKENRFSYTPYIMVEGLQPLK